MGRSKKRQAGFVITVEALLLFTIVVIAVIVALAAVRNALIESGIFLRPVLVFDSTAPDPLLVGKVFDLHDTETPRVLRRDPNNGLSVPLGVRRGRLTTHAPVFYTLPGCLGPAYVTGPGFLSDARVSQYHQLHGVIYAVGADPGGPGLLFRDDGTTVPCSGLGCPVVSSVWISEWTFADSTAPDPTPLDPCRALTPGTRDGLVPAVEVLDPATAANVLAPFVPPFRLR